MRSTFSRGDYRLREFQRSDASLILDWRNSERVRTGMYTDHVIGASEHACWVERAMADPRARYLVFTVHEEPSGFVYFTGIDALNQRASWGFYLGGSPKPGLGSVMEFLALEYAFEQLRLRKLCCEVFAFNAGVVRLHEKFGFQREGTLSSHQLKNGRFEDVVLLARFAEDWLVAKGRLAARVFSGKESSC